jgi:hypothetical protein
VLQASSAQALIDQAHAAAKPLNTHSISTAWRRQMVRVEVERALAETHS